MRGARRLPWLVGLLASVLVVGCGASVTVSPALPSATSAATSHFAASGISLDYPAAWNAMQLDTQFHYVRVLGLLGSGDFAEACPSDAQPGQMNTCTEQVSVSPGTVVVQVSTWQLPTPAGMSEVQYQQYADPSAVPMTVAGQRAVRSNVGEPMNGADQHLLWLVDAPGSSSTAYGVEAWLRGPDVAGLRAQLDAMIATAVVSAPNP
jgi:hypothetical protein